MRRTLLLALLIVLAGGSVSAQDEIRLDTLVAVVRLTETVNIGQRELNSEIKQIEDQLGQSLSDQQKQQLLDRKINEVLINQAADREGIEVTEQQVNRAIARQKANLSQQAGQNLSDQQFRRIIENRGGMSWNEYVSQIRQRLRQEQYILQTQQQMFDDVQQPSQEEINTYYEKNATQFSNPALVKFSHVFFDTRQASEEQRTEKRQMAQDLYQQVESGQKSFDQLLREAEDNPDFSGGDFGYLAREDRQGEQLLGEDFVNKVFQLDEGQLSQGVLESNVGFHIVKVTNRRDPKLLQLDDPIFPGQNRTVRQQIQNRLMLEEQQQVFNEALEKTISSLREEAEIDIKEQNLSW
jgi:parvulin-like peptidyl-prolyl isomerase